MCKTVMPDNECRVVKVGVFGIKRLSEASKKPT